MAMFLGACLPGPWDYTPEAKPVFRGVTLFAYAVNGRPAEDVCFERLLDLNEAASEGKAWYDSASVEIAGAFSDGSPMLVLTPKPGPANCFQGPAAALFLAGQSYTITARFVWDSAGTTATSVLSATARIPSVFSIRDTAYAPAYALTGVGDGPFNPAGLAPVPYQNGDSLFYLRSKKLGGFNLSELSHYFYARRNDEVRAVLMTRRFDSTAARPETSFDSIAGFIPGLSDFYQVGTINRLIVWHDEPSAGGRNLLDSIAMVNAWFWTGRNRIYFYGAEQIYADYQTALEEVAGNTKVRLPTNVSGGQGFFTGMVVDSFTVNIKLDGFTQAFDYYKTRAAACEEKGWTRTRDCIDFYREYCRDTLWTTADCRREAAYTALDAVDSLQMPAALRDSVRAWKAADPGLRMESAARYCIEENYPASVPACAFVRPECETGTPGNGCQQILWQRCELAYWDAAALPACAEGLKSFCQVNRVTHKILCRDVPN
jgi:hypothetical protein